ncbi:pilus assembly protein PilX [Yersinia kristensenii]|uniref:type 4 pilus major pilin n=1 Tax=Yersinia kristensenii TaxID=28152 RepID=UPI0011AAC895|nr:type 4 pilus major pilin [Yersinia kristensenii]MBW5818246.1 pilus assembly protein PilX [Yersinia kristensenii]MBW5844141.1 pilus assembly protein PilX [Yersinia kristensenii]MDA5490217.1 type 4 pilus major pilin [Yersinia kristensenii]
MSLCAVSRKQPHRGWGILESGGVALVVIIVITVVLGGIYMLWNRKDIALESANVQHIITSTQGLLKGRNGYNFTSGAAMTGFLIQVGGVPKSMMTKGNPTAGTATLWNTWGGQVVVAPVAANGFHHGFTVSYQKVPQYACIAITTRLSAGGSISGITINSTAYNDGNVTAENAGTACVKDTGRSGMNTLTFTVNG